MQGRRKLFYGTGGGRLSKNVTMVGQRREILKNHWLKCPKAVPKKAKFGLKYEHSRNSKKDHTFII